MRKYFVIFLTLVIALNCKAQDFNSLIEKTADTLSKKILIVGKKKIAITDFINIDESITQLGSFLSSEVSSELSNRTNNQASFRVLERANLDQIFKEKHLVSFTDPSGLAKELGKIDAADALIFATITDFDGYYRVVIKMLDTKNGDALCSYKVNFVKTPSLENLNKAVVKRGLSSNQTEKEVAKNDPPKSTGTGEFCFKNVDRVGYKATVSIYRPGKSSPFKSIDINYGDRSCMYELEGGVYTVNISWSDRWNNYIPPSTQEIKVISGQTGTIELQH